jgi:hypothetical protein
VGAGGWGKKPDPIPEIPALLLANPLEQGAQLRMLILSPLPAAKRLMNETSIAPSNVTRSGATSRSLAARRKAAEFHDQFPCAGLREAAIRSFRKSGCRRS